MNKGHFLIKMYLFLQLIILALHNQLISTIDPCDETVQGVLYREKYRGTLCHYRLGKTTFDREIKEQWYRINGVSGSLYMPTDPVPLHRCSTQFPGWMNGSHPSVEEGEVNRTVCFATHLSDCYQSYDISVKNCTGYYVYFLRQTTTNSEGYCFGVNETCPPLNPCEDIDREEDIVDDGSRSPYCKSDGPALCDNSVSGWYRVLAADKSHELSMPQFCPDYEHCGTENPIWLNDSYPNEEEGIVERTVCIRSSTSCCESALTIQIKNCSSYLAFNLTSVTECNQRYCFGNYTCDESTLSPEATSISYLQTTTARDGIQGLQRKVNKEEEIIEVIAIAVGVVTVVAVLSIISYYLYFRMKRRTNSVSNMQLVKR